MWEKQLHTLSSQPTLREPQGFSGRTPSKQQPQSVKWPHLPSTTRDGSNADFFCGWLIKTTWKSDWLRNYLSPEYLLQTNSTVYKDKHNTHTHTNRTKSNHVVTARGWEETRKKHTLTHCTCVVIQWSQKVAAERVRLSGVGYAGTCILWSCIHLLVWIRYHFAHSLQQYHGLINTSSQRTLEGVT